MKTYLYYYLNWTGAVDVYLVRAVNRKQADEEFMRGWKREGRTNESPSMQRITHVDLVKDTTKFMNVIHGD